MEMMKVLLEPEESFEKQHQEHQGHIQSHEQSHEPTVLKGCGMEFDEIHWQMKY